ncbi:MULTISPECIES: hypothetical protein [Spirosoma]|uniref:Uncharacterized protein n=1 Tax=Spirosoma sordidisoli TaxID=2502893 RepID=A0A4Q2UIU3_9BACT|nr:MULTISPECIES: hypothetical protein [Spirosoma]RYC69363.1 hypothetical protein EQG79_12175 [Spirosoma sordidisoli]
MKALSELLRYRNEPLYLFGLVCLLAAAVCLVLTRLTDVQVNGVSAWYKPFKFFLSTTLFVWTMAWYMFYLGPSRAVQIYSWGVILLLGFELIYIAVQAGRGQLSHFKVDTPAYAALYGMMALAAVAIAIWTGYIGVLFCLRNFPDLPAAYVWGIRIGIGLFVIFAIEGLAMGSQLRHTVGGPDGSPGLPVVNWSRTYGDLRIAHFMGMHAIQIIPILAYYALKSVRLTVVVGLLYGLATTLLFIQAMRGKPFWPL